MTSEEKIEFEKLQKSSKGLIESRQFPGLKKLLSQFYPDKNHFIYELLQNAEDAGATRVEFQVCNDRLIFSHNGPEPFTNRHIDAITNISFSTKLEDDSKAGKFGIGFKSVYAFTETPYIYTDRISFAIKDMFYPEELPSRRTQGMTIFEFPFNNEKLSPEQAIEKIEKGLRDISATTLLFLSNVREINYTLTNGKAGIIIAEHEDKNSFDAEDAGFTFAEFIHCSSVFDDGKQDEDSDWLRFNRKINIKLGEDEKIKSRFVNIAFPIKKSNANNEYNFITKEGKVSIFFLAPNAKSNLYFHINAPFGCPPSRDSVSDTEDNKLLVAEIAELVHDAIMYLRDNHELTPAFFNILPLQSDQVDSFYNPIKESMIKIFSQESVYPTITDGYKRKIEVISTNEQIRKLFPITDMRTLMAEQEIFFLLNPQTRGYTFISENKVTRIDGQTILMFLSHLQTEQINRLFSGRSAEWYKAVYSLLFEPATKNDVTKLKNCKIILSKNGEMVDSHQARFLEDPSLLLDQQYKEVSHEVYGGSTDKNKDKSRQFLELIGVKDFTKNDSIAISKERYRDNLQKALDELIVEDDIIAVTKKLLKYYRSSDYDTFPLDFEDRAFVLNDSDILVEPKDCYLDAPYVSTGLAIAESIHGKSALSKKYKEKLSEKELQDLLEILKDKDIFYRFEIEQASIYNNPRYSDLMRMPSNISRETCSARRDWNIVNLKEYIQLQDVRIAKLIWDAIMPMNYRYYWWEDDLSSKIWAYRQWQQTVRTEVPSQIVCILRDSEWLPDKNCNFHKPSQLMENTLHDGFKVNRNSRFYNAIKFGEEERLRREQKEREEQQRSEEHQRKEEAANELGYESIEQFERDKKDADEYRKALAEGRIKAPVEYKHVDEPSSRIAKPDKRRENVQKEVLATGDREYQTKERAVRTSNAQVLEEAKIMLQTHYTNNDELMFCQCCWKELPFKKRNGDYYFEAIELDERGGKYFPKETKYPYIACCPTCAAMFKEFIINTNIESKGIYSIIQKIKGKETIKHENGNETIEIEMDKRTYPLTFVEKHIEDIRSTLLVERK